MSGAWNVDANWINTPAMGGFPNNGNGGVPTYDALIDVTRAAYTVTLSTNITVEDLSLNAGHPGHADLDGQDDQPRRERGASEDSDYTNASFGVGNAFDAHAAVVGSGQIVASGNVNQTLGGAVTNGGTPTATLNLGSIHVGGAVTMNYLINNAGTTGPPLRGAIQITAASEPAELD